MGFVNHELFFEEISQSLSKPKHIFKEKCSMQNAE